MDVSNKPKKKPVDHWPSFQFDIPRGMSEFLHFVLYFPFYIFLEAFWLISILWPFSLIEVLSVPSDNDGKNNYRELKRDIFGAVVAREYHAVVIVW